MEHGRLFQVVALVFGSMLSPLAIPSAAAGPSSGFAFLSQPQNITTLRGQTVRFTCQVSTLESWQNIIWRYRNSSNVDQLLSMGNRVLFGGSERSVAEEDDGTKSVLSVRASSADVEGGYVCTVPGITETQDNYLTVSVPATIVDPPPEGRTVEVEEGQMAPLFCIAVGKPLPAITWERQGSVIGIGQQYTIVDASKNDSGAYRCSADNGAGDAAATQYYVNVRYGPTVQVSAPVIRVKVAANVTLECVFDSFPPVEEVTWSRDGEFPIDFGAQVYVSRENQGDGHVISRLHLATVRVKDVGVYRCRGASSVFGVTSETISVCGLPYDVRIVSPDRSRYSNRYIIQWEANSQSPMQEAVITIVYRPKDMDLADDESNSTVNGTSTSNQSTMTIPVKISSHRPGAVLRQETVVNQLAPNSTYEMRIRVKNVFGFSDWTGGFLFKTAEEGNEAPLTTTKGMENSAHFSQDVVCFFRLMFAASIQTLAFIFLNR